MTKDAITDVLFKGRFYEWWCLKEGTAFRKLREKKREEKF